MIADSQLQAIICTSNLAAARRFYGEVLELAVVVEFQLTDQVHTPHDKNNDPQRHEYFAL